MATELHELRDDIQKITKELRDHVKERVKKGKTKKEKQELSKRYKDFLRLADLLEKKLDPMIATELRKYN